MSFNNFSTFFCVCFLRIVMWETKGHETLRVREVIGTSLILMNIRNDLAGLGNLLLASLIYYNLRCILDYYYKQLVCIYIGTYIYLYRYQCVNILTYIFYLLCVNNMPTWLCLSKSTIIHWLVCLFNFFL